MMDTGPLDRERTAAAVMLLWRAGHPEPCRFVPLAGGANNQVYRVETSGEPLVLKCYYRHPDDPRDRLAADYGYSTFAWQLGVRALPRPITADPAAGLALFEHIGGQKLTAVDAGAVRQALDFYLDVNAGRASEAARALPVASEACFSLEEHLRTMRRRLERLRGLPAQTPLDREAADFVWGRLTDRAAAVEDAVCDAAARCGVGLDAPLASAERRLSPSDFGFHNALVTADGTLKFLDFEYSGWDDPAKMVADFFCQPERPAPETCFADFAAAVAADLPCPELHRWRCALLWPVYRVKWCCIMLNDFLPAGRRRRRFAAGTADEEARKRRQLAKARAAAARIVPPGVRRDVA